MKELGAALDTLGRGRFDIVSWDPRGTGESDHVVCFDDEHDQQRFWGPDWSIPTTRAESRRYLPKTVAFARRCRALSGVLFAHISTADTVRDLDHLRELVGDPQLTYRGISYGTFLGQTYANMFPSRVRARVLNGLVDAVAFTSGVATSIASNISDADLVFEKFRRCARTQGRSAAGSPARRRSRCACAAVAGRPAAGADPGPVGRPTGRADLWRHLDRPLADAREPRTMARPRDRARCGRAISTAGSTRSTVARWRS